MWSMLNLQQPKDFVIASGTPHSLEQFVAAAFGELGLDWRAHVDFDPAVSRPSDIACSVGNAERAKRLLDWKPTVTFAEIVSRMLRGEREGAAAVS
jgi:GDPmannose 4,6-dehydratase